MRTERGTPANFLHAPDPARRGAAEACEARLERLLADPVVQRIMRREGQPRDLMIRTARAVRLQAAEARTQR